MYFTLDFETQDNYIPLGLGSGWVYKLNIPETEDFELLGWGYCLIDDNKQIVEGPEYVVYDDNSKQRIEQLLKKCGNKMISHYATYELGCLLVMGIDIKPIQVLDTEIIAKLYNNELGDYSLEHLSEIFLPEDQRKAIDILVKAALKHDLLQIPKRDGYDTERFQKAARKWCYRNMKLLQETDLDAVAKYCEQDIVAEANLFLKLVEV